MRWKDSYDASVSPKKPCLSNSCLTEIPSPSSRVCLRHRQLTLRTRHKLKLEVVAVAEEDLRDPTSNVWPCDQTALPSMDGVNLAPSSFVQTTTAIGLFGLYHTRRLDGRHSRRSTLEIVQGDCRTASTVSTAAEAATCFRLSCDFPYIDHRVMTHSNFLRIPHNRLS